MNKYYFFSIIFICVVVGSGFYFIGRGDNAGKNNQELIDLTSAPVLVKRSAPKGWQEYRNDQYGFSLLHPSVLSVNERFEVGGVITIVFQNVKEQKGFQIFIVPYEGDRITEERFKKDIPSGVRTHTENVDLDGVSGVAFYSKDANLGDTREVWFINRNFLYEVTTPKSDERMLSEILLTLIFTDTKQ